MYYGHLGTVLGDIRKIKAVRHCNKLSWYHGTIIVKKFFLVFCIFTTLSPPNCIDIHIKCLVRLEVTHRPNLPEVTNTGIYIAQYYLGTNHKCPDYQGVLIFQVNSYDKAVLF